MPILKEGQLDIISHSAEQTQRLGARLGVMLKPGDVICLSGDMGAGKTVFAAGIGKGWGVMHPISSPTFNLTHDHTRQRDKMHLYHLDCYRLERASEAEAIGIDDILSGKGAVVIEWPEHILDVLPPERLWIDIRVLEPTRRNFSFQANGQRYEDMIARFRQDSFGV